jgi:hypothetical protein
VWGFGVWGIIDLFKMSAIVGDYNRDVAVDIVRTVAIVSK